MKHKNDMTKIPAAACPRCGGWTTCGGMSQHYNAVEPVLGRTGCTCGKQGLTYQVQVKCSCGRPMASVSASDMETHRHTRACKGCGAAWVVEVKPGQEPTLTPGEAK